MTTKYKYSGDRVLDVETGTLLSDDPHNGLWKEYLLYDGTTAPEYTQVEWDNKGWIELRDERNQLLKATDFMMTQDFYVDSMTGQEQIDVKAYRTDLRDLPGNTPDPHDVTWPTKPQIVIDNGI